MTTYTVSAGHAGIEPYTTTASQVDTITFTDNVNNVQVISDGGAEVRVTIDGTTSPAIGSAGASSPAYRMPAGTVSTLDVPLRASVDTIKLVSSGAAVVSVQQKLS